MAVCFFVRILPSQADVLVVKHYDQGYTPSIRAYQRDLLQLILRRSEAEFGPYQLEFYSRPLTTNRAKIVLQQGVDVNVLFASEWQGWGVDPSQVIGMELPIYKGLHGLRNILIRTADIDRFERLNSIDDFMKLSAGQGANWLDVRILRASHVQTIEAQNFANLMPMLQKKRFDYLPLSILESDSVMQDQPAEINDITLYRDLLIFYPLPSYLYIPKNQPKIAERLLAGFKKVAKNGELDELFNHHFSAVAESVRGNKKRLVILENPGLSAEKNRDMIANLVAAYGSGLEVLH